MVIAGSDSPFPQRAVLHPPILAGRAREQHALREELTIAISGRGGLVLLGGEAGIGKTTLARVLVRAAGEQGVHVLAGSCYDLTNTPPYGPWRDVFAACQSDPAIPAPPSAFAGGHLASVTDQAVTASCWPTE